MHPYFRSILLCAVAVLMSGCLLRGKPAPVKATPPPPAPPVVHASPPPEPLSIPQTQVQLPAPQPISEEALAAVQDSAVLELPEPPAQRGSSRVAPSRLPGMPKPEMPAQAQGPATPPPATLQPQTPEPERPIVQERITPEEQKRLTESLAARRKEISAYMEQAGARGGSQDERALMNRVRSFLELADKAAASGDLRQADALAERAQILARELPNAK